MDDMRSWYDALAAQEEKNRNRQMADMANYNRAQMDQYGQMLGAQAAQAAQQRSNGFLQSAIAMRFARQNGGTIPVGMLDALNRKLGFDGKTKRLVGGAFEKDGNFKFFMQNGDGQGNFVDAPIMLDRRGQFALMRSAPGVFDTNEIDAMRQELMVKDGYTLEEIYGRGPLPGSRTETGGVVVPKSWMGTPERRGGAVFSSDGRGGFSNTRIAPDGSVSREDGGTRDANYKGRWRVLSSGSHGDGQRGTRYENDKTGEVVFVPEGQTLESVTRAGSEKERIARINASGKIAAEEMKDRRERDIADAKNQTQIAAAELRSGNSSKPSARFDGKAYSALNNYLTELTTDADGNKRELSPEEQKKADRIRAKMDEMLGVGGTDESQDIAQAGATSSDLARQELARRMAAKKAQAQDGGQQQQTQSAKNAQQQAQEDAQDDATQQLVNRGQVVVSKSASEIAGKKVEPQRTQQEQPADMTAAQIVQKRNAGKPQEPVDENEQRLRDEEKDRIRRMTEMGGEVTDERGGKRRVKIANWDYLSDDEKRQWPEYSSRLTEDVVMAQRLANEAKERWEAQWGENSEWYKGEVDEIRKQAKKRHPDNAGQRRRYIEKKIERLKARSRGENPTFKRELEDSRFSAFISY